MANYSYLRSYLLSALLVFLVVFRHLAVRDRNIECQERASSHSITTENGQAVEWQAETTLTAEDKSNGLRDGLQKIYQTEVGVRELSGKNDGKRVEEYLAATNLGKGHAWCAAFVSWSFAKAGFEEPNTPWSPALFPENRIIWTQKTKTEALEPRKGDVFGIWFPRLGRIAHAGFVDEWGQAFIITVEGNTNEVGSAEGDGVYRRRRPIGSIHKVANWIDRP